MATGTDMSSFSVALYRFRGPKDGTPATPTGFCGSAFVLTGGLLVSCRHCFEDYPLAKNEWYGAVYEKPDKSGLAVLFLDAISFDPSGVDLATALCGLHGSPLMLTEGIDGIAQSVGSIGYPGTHGTIPDGRVSGDQRFTQEARWLEGYVSRAFLYTKPKGGALVRSWEIDMPAPRGHSGAPVILLRPTGPAPVVVGVVYGAHVVTPDKGAFEAVPNGYAFSLAHYYDSLHELRGEALGSESLAEYMTRHGRMSSSTQRD